MDELYFVAIEEALAIKLFEQVKKSLLTENLTQLYSNIRGNGKTLSWTLLKCINQEQINLAPYHQSNSQLYWFNDGIKRVWQQLNNYNIPICKLKVQRNVITLPNRSNQSAVDIGDFLAKQKIRSTHKTGRSPSHIFIDDPLKENNDE